MDQFCFPDKVRIIIADGQIKVSFEALDRGSIDNLTCWWLLKVIHVKPETLETWFTGKYQLKSGHVNILYTLFDQET